ncbi:hypothetical protein TALC_00981 [Thermoplasmatales archaeon BRNA1]|nr:hypothetical protein TALC_00981 [Thermoplasmatales archaeon BRNA1]
MAISTFDIYDEQKPKKPLINPLISSFLALATGIIGMVCFLIGVYAGALVFGACGLFFGGNSFGHGVKVMHESDDYKPAVISGVGLLLSVIAFMFGFVGVI